MSAPVDVLAVMDELIDFEERHAEYEPRQNHEAREARAAVAELIEKVEELLSTHGVYSGYGGAGEAIEGHMRAELVAAIARAKGGAA